MIPHERQEEVRALAGPIIEETLGRLVRCGIAPHEIAQIMIMTGAGLLAGALGPKHAGYAMGEVAEAVGSWIHSIGEKLEARETH
jgi:hypothetical protein